MKVSVSGGNFNMIRWWLVVLVMGLSVVTARAWMRTFGGEANEQGTSIVRISDSLYVVAGWTESFGQGGADFWLLAIDDLGDTLWSRTYGGAFDDKAYSVILTPDSGYLLAGSSYSFSNDATDSDFWVVKTDREGRLEWSRNLGGPFDEVATSAGCNDTLYFISGWTTSYGNGGMDFWLVVLNAEGQVQTTMTYGGEEDDWCNSSLLKDGLYYMAGGTKSFGNGSTDAWLISYDPRNLNNVSVMPVTYGTEAWDEVRGFRHTTLWSGESRPGFILTGFSDTRATLGDNLWIFRTVSNHEEWNEYHGGAEDEWGNDVLVAHTKFVIVGTTYSFGTGGDLWLVSSSYDGKSPWKSYYGGAELDEGLSLALHYDDLGAMVTGYTNSFGAGESDLWVIRTDSMGDTIPEPADTTIVTGPPTYKIVNPIANQLRIEYTDWTEGFYAVIFDKTGRIVDEIESETYTGVILWDPDIPHGVYFIRPQCPEAVTHKLVMIK